MPDVPLELVAIVVSAIVGVLALPWRSLAVSESSIALSSASEWFSRMAGRAIARHAPDPHPAQPRPHEMGRSIGAPRPSLPVRTVHPDMRVFTPATPARTRAPAPDRTAA